jgi:hypothetical protein
MRGHNLIGLIDQGFMELNPTFQLARNLFVWDSTRGLGESQFLFVPSGFAEAFYVYLLSWVAPNFSVLSFLKLFLLQLAYYAGGFITLATFVKYVLKKSLTAQVLSGRSARPPSTSSFDTINGVISTADPTAL